MCRNVVGIRGGGGCWDVFVPFIRKPSEKVLDPGETTLKCIQFNLTVTRISQPSNWLVHRPGELCFFLLLRRNEYPSTRLSRFRRQHRKRTRPSCNLAGATRKLPVASNLRNTDKLAELKLGWPQFDRAK